METVLVAFTNPAAMNEFLIAWLADWGLDSFEERPDGLDAYADTNHFNEKEFREFVSGHFLLKNIPFRISLMEAKNWNAEWEKNFQPIMVDETIYVRAPFHPASKKFRYEIVIEPKMSFGTGHHATTALMMQQMNRMDLRNKKVLDMGCGSGILAILAGKMGASEIDAIDTDDWAVQNSIENCARNNTQHIHVQKGDSASLNGRHFDVILANINRNVLLDDIPVYSGCIEVNGILLLSGFYVEDRAKILERAAEFGLSPAGEKTNEQWIAICLQKN